MRTFWTLATATLALTFAHAGELQVIDDFEQGVRPWYLVQGPKLSDTGPLCTIIGSQEAKVGRGAARLRYVGGANSWAHLQKGLRTLDWIANDCDRISLWVRGDGSGEKFNLMFGNYERKPGLCFQYPIVLDFTGWKQVIIPFGEFSPKGQMGAHVGELVLAQLNAQAPQKPIDILIDELVALPAERGRKQRFFDLIVPATSSWDKPNPAEPIAVDNLLGLVGQAAPNGLIHGVRNHQDLHHPVSFSLQYPEAGTFGVKITKTSGYGGSRLLLKVDGEEKLRQDFPGETETSLDQYTGYYSVEVAAGKHVLTVDNDGNDWLTVEAFCFGNARSANARLRREEGRLEAVLRDGEGHPLPGLTVTGEVAGTGVPLVQQADGTWLSDCLWGRFPQGVYPIAVTARRGQISVFATTVTAPLGSAHGRPARTYFTTGQDVNLDLLYFSEADVPLEQQKLTVTIGGKSYPCVELSAGTYRAALGKLPAGRYQAQVTVAPAAGRVIPGPSGRDGGPHFEAPFLVYDPAGKPWEKEGLTRLGGNGWFTRADGKSQVPWGYATIGVFAPDPEFVVNLPAPTQWCRASDEDVRNWIALLASYGVNCVRFGVTVDARNIGGDTGGHADPWMIERLRHFLDLIGPMGVRAVPVMWWGHYRNFNYNGIPAYDALIEKQADWFLKPEALALHQQYVREVVTPFKDDPRILAWEVMNETYRAGGDIEGAIRWTNQILKTMRECSPRHLMTTSAAEATPNPELAWVNGADVDFFNYHEYPTYPNYNSTAKLLGEATHELGTYAAVITLCNKLGTKVSLLGEAGNDRMGEASYPEVRQLITRDCLWLSFLHGSPGGISWDAIADPREFGVLSQITRGIDWSVFKPAPTPLVVEVTEADAQMADVTRYVWWSLQHGVPLSLLRAGEAAQKGQRVLPGERFAPPTPAPAATLAVSAGLQAASLQSADGKTFLGYVRNVSGREIISTRVRQPVRVTVTVRPLKPGTFQVWDLDMRTVVKRVAIGRETRLDLGQTAHDFAVVRVGN